VIESWPRHRVWAAGIAVWTALPLLMAAETAIWLNYRNQPVDWAGLLWFRIADWYACGIFVPLLVWATVRWPVDRRHLATRLPLHLLLLVGVSMGKIVLFHSVRGSVGLPTQATLTQMIVRTLITEIVAFGATAAAIHAIVFYRRYREREALSVQLQARLSDAQLHALRAQLNPHFLFNTLNAVTTLLHRDPERADAMLTRLGDLLRMTLRAEPDHEIPLREELQLLDRYVEIMEMRFSDRVVVTRDVDPASPGALVPSFVLQPIVENAFEHGVARVHRNARVEVSTRIEDGTRLVLSVRDNGPGPDDGARPDGIGISNTRRRLEEMYAGAGSLTMSAPPGGGTLVEVRLPLRVPAPA
jgi:two-component system LytT family sensor kinase